MRVSQFLILAIFTALATYWMNAAFIAGDYFWACLYAFFVFRNLRFSYRVTKFIQTVIPRSKKKG
ncbi:DUF3272 domain-containing protein [Streptococcus gallolyticus]|uniref:DUF3272 family protein n=1 Tax=Streptococcus hepaticus TaxID=3349163 RepID=UPI001C98E129|nr:DUF3272 domain-containing protein [Streptococcus gallolyticus]MBY5041727.1 DUF3272 domain-containing protein [Streptococcus gallolyticus]